MEDLFIGKILLEKETNISFSTIFDKVKEKKDGRSSCINFYHNYITSENEWIISLFRYKSPY
jgi:hypothetical protein